jgi:hypothetical protein
MSCAKKQAPSLFDFPEDGWPLGSEFLAKEKLLEALTGFARGQLAECMADPDGMFCPGIREAIKKGGDSVHDMLWINIMDWLLFDRAVDNEGRTNADLYWSRKKMFLPGLQKKVLAMMRMAKMELFEIRAVYPGRGFELKRLGDGSMFQVVEMKASRSLSRWTILASRLWVLDDAYRLSGSMYWFQPRQRPHVLARQKKIMRADGDPWDSRERFSPEICRVWIDPLIHPVPRRFCNRDGDEIVICRAVFQVDDLEAARKALCGQKEIIINDVGDDMLDWFSLEKDAAGQPTVLGIFRFQEGELRFECNSRHRFRRGMKVLEKTLGDSIRLKKKELIPWQELFERGEDTESKEVEIPSDVQKEIIQDYMRKRMENWPGTRVPLLGDKTPRQAVRTKAGRAAVARLLKEFENAEEEKRRRGDPAVDPGFLWRELDLDPEDY